MTPAEFCQLAMVDFEQQWAAAAGHQQRHPIRVKMELLRTLTEQAGDPEQFTRLLAEGCTSDDPYRHLLCADLLPWWKRVNGLAGGT
jgi:hypothetical protein